MHTGQPGKAVPDMTVIVYPIDKKLFLTAEYPISPVTVPDVGHLIEPSFSFKDGDKALKCIMRFIFGCHLPYSVLLVIHVCRKE
jgi:hypothetical protein